MILGIQKIDEVLIPLMILNALEDKPLPIYGDGMQIRDWLYVEDHARALVAALMRGMPGEVYAIGGGSELTNLALVRMLCEGLEARRGDPARLLRRPAKRQDSSQFPRSLF